METPRKFGGIPTSLLVVLVAVALVALVLTMRAPRVKAYRWTADMAARVGRHDLTDDLRARADLLERGMADVHYSSRKAEDREAFEKAYGEFHSQELIANPRFILMVEHWISPDEWNICVEEKAERKLRRHLRDRGFLTD